MKTHLIATTIIAPLALLFAGCEPKSDGGGSAAGSGGALGGGTPAACR